MHISPSFAGIVEVIADDRLPDDHHKTAVDQKANESYLKKRTKYRAKEAKVTDQIATGIRSRRAQLKNIYLESKSTGSITSKTQKEVWDLYCKRITPKEIIKDDITWNGKVSGKMKEHDRFLEVDPRIPADHYPDRIVECKLVEDDREIRLGNIINGDVSGDGEVECEINPAKNQTTKTTTLPMRLYLKRRELIRESGPSERNFTCNNCGKKDYKSRDALSYHIKSRQCLRGDDERVKRQYRFEDIESKALSDPSCVDNLLTNIHGVVKFNEVSRVTKAAGTPNGKCFALFDYCCAVSVLFGLS